VKSIVVRAVAVLASVRSGPRGSDVASGAGRTEASGIRRPCSSPWCPRCRAPNACA